jgi:hypothetical protein
MFSSNLRGEGQRGNGALTGLFAQLMVSRRREPVAQPVEQLTFNLVGANAPAGNWLFCLAFALSSSS